MNKTEIQNVVVLIEAGARALANQNPLNKAAEIMSAANDLIQKVLQLDATE
jgi:hypothetical protein